MEPKVIRQLDKDGQEMKTINYKAFSINVLATILTMLLMTYRAVSVHA